MNNNLNITRLIVNFFLSIFVIVTILIVLFLGLYYFTPNNYVITKLDMSKYKSDKKKFFNIGPNSKIKLSYSDYSDYSDYYIGFDLETNLMIQNSFKSQNIFISPDIPIQIRFGSDVFIINPTENEINLNVTFYSKI